MVDIDIDWKFLAADGLEIAPSRASEERHGDRVSPDGSGNRVTYRMFSGFPTSIAVRDLFCLSLIFKIQTNTFGYCTLFVLYFLFCNRGSVCLYLYLLLGPRFNSWDR